MHAPMPAASGSGGGGGSMMREPVRERSSDGLSPRDAYAPPPPPRGGGGKGEGGFSGGGGSSRKASAQVRKEAVKATKAVATNLKDTIAKWKTGALDAAAAMALMEAATKKLNENTKHL